LHFVWYTHYSVHKALLKKYNPHNVERRHKQQFVGWFEDKVSRHICFEFIMLHVESISLFFVKWINYRQNKNMTKENQVS